MVASHASATSSRQSQGAWEGTGHSSVHLSIALPSPGAGVGLLCLKGCGRQAGKDPRHGSSAIQREQEKQTRSAGRALVMASPLSGAQGLGRPLNGEPMEVVGSGQVGEP